MIQTSERFHAAIREDQPQFPLFLFNDGRVILPEDIDLDSGGFSYSDNVMDGEDYHPGAIASSTMSINLLNDSGAWSDYEFGEFTAWLGVRVEQKVRKTNGNCVIAIGSTVFEGYSVAPYLRLDNAGVKGVNKPVKAMILINSNLYAFTGTSYYVLQYTGTIVTMLREVTTMDNLLWHSRTWCMLGYSMTYGYTWPNKDAAVNAVNALMTFVNGRENHFEMIRLGIFNAERPVFGSNKTVSLDCFDRMVKFDEKFDQTKFASTTHNLLNFVGEIAAAVGVPYASSSSEFANSDATISNPDLSESTYREVLKYIGELSGTFAKITREGALQMTWFSNNPSVELGPHDYSDCQIGYYDVAPISKVVVRDYESDDITSGSGENALYISNNPLAKVISLEGAGT